MKKNHFILLFFIILVSCDNKCEELKDKFVNNSGRQIEIISFKNYYPGIPFGTLSKRQIIQNNSNIMNVNKICPPSTSELDFGNLIEGDSMVIDFGDRKLRYGTKNLTSPRNPVYLSRINQDRYNFTYTLTPEDYANALP